MATDKVQCEACNKTVYPMERVVVDKHNFHEKCFKCATCQKRLTTASCSSVLDGKFYCKPHFVEATRGAKKSSSSTDNSASLKASADKASADKAAAEKAAVAKKQADEKAAAEKAATEKAAAEKAKPAAAPAAKAPAKPAPAKKEAKKEFDPKTKKWRVEYFDGEQITIEATAAAESVSIYNCNKCTISVVGKVTNILASGCTGCGFVFDSVISGFEIVNCKKVQIQINDKAPQVILDKSVGVVVYMSGAEAKDTKIVTSLTDEVNVVIPAADEEEEDVELFVPVQYLSKIVNGVLVTTPTEHV